MKRILAWLAAAAIGTAALCAADSKNWTPPAGKMYAQTLVEHIMSHHPELISATLHGVPPGMDKVYTMFAGSYVDRIGNADDPDDIMVIQHGITILDPRWHRPNDPVRKYVVQLPLRDASGEDVGLLVLAFHRDDRKGDLDYLAAANRIRDALAKRIPGYDALFQPAR